jgi:hypothetical protein
MNSSDSWPIHVLRGEPEARARLLWSVLMLASLVVVAAPRFSQHDWGPIGKPTGASDRLTGSGSDASRHITYVHYLRRDAPFTDLRAPFVYRPLVPLLAAVLPCDAMTALSVVALLALGATLFLLYRLLIGIGFLWQYAVPGPDRVIDTNARRAPVAPTSGRIAAHATPRCSAVQVTAIFLCANCTVRGGVWTRPNLDTNSIHDSASERRG